LKSAELYLIVVPTSAEPFVIYLTLFCLKSFLFEKDSESSPN